MPDLSASTGGPHPLAAADAATRIAADHDVLLSRTAGLSAADLAAPYRPEAGPLGDFCESLHDLVAHVLMWDEINLAALAEAAAGRRHWSLDPRWETREAGQALNRGGVEAGRQLPGDLLLHRIGTVRDAILAEFTRHDGPGWAAAPDGGESPGTLAQRVWTVPGYEPFWHAAIHLGGPRAAVTTTA